MGARAPRAVPLLLALGAGALLAALDVHNARALAPHWGQDLAFFTQICESARQGGPWGSPLLLEPQGMFAMVHTHLVLPLVVAAYTLWPRPELLLVAHGLFAGLTLWPAFRLAETVAHERGLARPTLLAALAAGSLLLLGPFQLVGSADFRPNVLFLPGVLGVFAAAREGRVAPALAWSTVAQLGRQEASYLLLPVGLALAVLPWGGVRRPRVGLAVAAYALAWFGAWVLLKPEMFHHFDPRQLGAPGAPVDPSLLPARGAFALRLLRSGALLGLLQPLSLLAGLPMAAQLARDVREWTALVGPTVHYHAFWLPFVLPSALAGALAWPRRLGGGAVGVALLALLQATSFPWALPRRGPVALQALIDRVPPDARLAADHDTIGLLGGRAVLWNVDTLHLPPDQRPYGWTGDWPLTVDQVDLVLLPAGHRLAPHLAGWRELGRVELPGRTELLLARP